MITLLTTDPAAVYGADGLRPAIDTLHVQVQRLAQAVADGASTRVLLMSEAALVTAAGHADMSTDNPLAFRVSAVDIEELCERFCLGRERRDRLVIIEDADTCFFSGREPGEFTRRLNLRLIERLSVLGEYLAGYDGHLVVGAAMNQLPGPLTEVLVQHGWSWVVVRGGRLQTLFGEVPPVIAPFVGAPPPDEDSDGLWSQSETVGSLAAMFDVHRNTMSKWLKEGTIRHRRIGGQIQVRVSDIPQKPPQ